MKNKSQTHVARRSFLQCGTGAFGAAALGGPLAFLHTKAMAASLQIDPAVCGTRGDSPYGQLAPAKDMATGLELIMLPKGFSYTTFSWYGDTMSDGNKVQEDHDGMAVVGSIAPGRGRSRGKGRGPNGRANEIALIRNHEVVGGPPISPTNNYNPAAGGGTTVLRFEKGKLVDDRVSVSGTVNNCAGGPTGWGTWLTCEERIDDIDGIPHGYCFESLPFAGEQDRDAWGVPVALKAMGRMKHEAVAVDRNTGYVYETEDNSDDGFEGTRGTSGFYKFVPKSDARQPRSLEAGGELYILAVEGINDLRIPACGDTYGVKWVKIEQPDSPAVPTGGGEEISGPFNQGHFELLDSGADLVGSRFVRLEGCWWDSVNELIYFVDTEAGNAREGAVWCYDPANEHLTCVFVAAGPVAADNPDNLTVSPRGGVMLCEDGGRDDGNGLSLLGLQPNGQTFEFARNIINITPADTEALVAAGHDPSKITPRDYSGQEWAGATFDPTGRWLFVNIQTPGITFAITGPWRRGIF